MVDDRLPNGSAKAFDASVYTEERTETSQRETKTAAAVEYFERELGKAEETIHRLEGKREKFVNHVDEVDQEISDAEEARDELQAELDSAKSQLEELTEVAP